MTSPRHASVLRAARFRRAVALVVALVFVLLSATSVLAASASVPEIDGRIVATGAVATDAGLAAAQPQDDPDDTGQPGAPHALPCHCHAVIGGDPEPYALAVAAGVIGAASPMPDRCPPSRPAAPPIRPPCL